MELNEILNDIEARAEAARPGPWIANGNTVTDWKGSHVSRSHTNGGQFDNESAAFIADARTDVPALVKALRRAVAFASMIHDTTPDWRESASSLKSEITTILKGKTP